MADTKISGLTVMTVPASTDEFAVNQASTSKRVTLDQLETFLNSAMLGMIEATARGYNMP